MPIISYNPASGRIKEETGAVDVPGWVTLIVEDGTLTNLGRGRVWYVPPGKRSYAFEPAQDPSDPRTFIIPGADTWIADSIRLYLNGQRLRTALLVISGTGNRTITLDVTVPAPDFTADPPDVVEGEGVKA